MSFSVVLPEPLSLREHVVFQNTKPIGIVNPATLLADCGVQGQLQVIGPTAAAWSKSDDPNSLLAALLATGSILLGSEDSVLQVQGYLFDAAYSRTASYLCSIAKKCEDIVTFFSSLSAASVAVIGCGGIGSLSALILAGAGVNSLILVDPDIVEISNFNRQFFWTIADIGAHKAKALKERLEERHPGIQATPIIKSLSICDLEEIISAVDGVVFTGDEPIGLVRDARRTAFECGKIFVSGGYVLSEAVVSTSGAPRPTDQRNIFRVSNGIAPSFGPTNVEVAGACTTWLMLRLGGLIEDQSADVSWNTHTWPWGQIPIQTE